MSNKLYYVSAITGGEGTIKCEGLFVARRRKRAAKIAMKTWDIKDIHRLRVGRLKMDKELYISHLAVSIKHLTGDITSKA